MPIHGLSLLHRGSRLLRIARRVEAVALHIWISMTNIFRHMVRASDLLRPVYAIYELTYSCNLNCCYCDDGAGRSYPPQAAAVHPLPLNEAVVLLRRLRRELPAIYISGGEPTVHPQFSEILREVHRLGFRPIMLSTNGLRLADLVQRDPALFKLIDILFLSVDACRPAVLDRLFRSKPGDGLRVLAALELSVDLASRSGCSLVVSSVITRETVTDTREVARLCKEYDILFAPVPVNSGKHLRDCFDKNLDYQALVQDILGCDGPKLMGDSAVFQKLLRFLPFECHPSLRIHVTPDGRVPWPCQSDARFALPLLEYSSVSSLMAASERRYSTQNQGQHCGSRCYLAQNVSTDACVFHPFRVAKNAFRDFIVKRAVSRKCRPSVSKTGQSDGIGIQVPRFATYGLLTSTISPDTHRLDDNEVKV